MAIRAFWYELKNVGDLLTPIILQAVFQEPVEWDRTGNGRWIMAGSMIHEAHDKDIIFGTGCFEDSIVHAKDLTVLAVRGPYTADKIGIKNVPFGDAGLILPKIFPKNNPDDRLAIIPHYADYEEAITIAPRFCINVREPPLIVIDKISKCRAVLSSSLHGIVIAEAYGVPAFRTAFTNPHKRIRSFDYKHADYYLGTGRELPPPLSVDDFLNERFPEVNLDGVQKAVDNIYDSLMTHITHRRV